MAYRANNLNVLAYANGFTLWHYTTSDPHDAVTLQGYFNAAADMLHIGDMILAGWGKTPDCVPGGGVLMVALLSGGDVLVVKA